MTRATYPESELPPVIVVGRVSLVVASMCARDGVPDEDVAAHANEVVPTGIDSPWVVDAEHEANQRCGDYENRRHVVVIC